MDKKTIMIYPNEKLHSLYNPLIAGLSKEYNLIYNNEESKKRIVSFLSGFKGLRVFYHTFIRKYFNLHALSQNNNPLPKNDLVYAYNTIPPIGCAFILDLEMVTALSGYNFSGLNRDEIKKRLEDPNCKAINCWNDSSYITLIKTIDCSNFLNKIHIIPFGITSKQINKHNTKDINFLFVSSTNNPQDFELKGGLITLDVFSKISSLYPNSKLYIRSQIPKEIKLKYQNNNQIVFIDNFLSNEEMDELFNKTDILLEPVPGINLMLNCMNYKIPIIAFDYWIIPEMVNDGKNGLLVSSDSLFGDINNTEKYLDRLHLNYLKLLDEDICLSFSKPFLDNAIELIEDESLRNNMGIYSKQLIEKDGPYSIDNYNQKIFNLIREALK